MVSEGPSISSIRSRASALGPTSEDIGHFLRSHTAGDALAAGFVAEEVHRVQRHIEHAALSLEHHDGAGAEHRAGGGHRFKIERDFQFRSGKISGRGAGGRERFDLLPGGGPPPSS